MKPHYFEQEHADTDDTLLVLYIQFQLRKFRIRGPVIGHSIPPSSSQETLSHLRFVVYKFTKLAFFRPIDAIE